MWRKGLRNGINGRKWNKRKIERVLNRKMGTSEKVKSGIRGIEGYLVGKGK
jgi:hypothetical protein